MRLVVTTVRRYGAPTVHFVHSETPAGDILTECKTTIRRPAADLANGRDVTCKVCRPGAPAPRPRYRVTTELALRVRLEYRDGALIVELVERHKLSQHTVHRIITGRHGAAPGRNLSRGPGRRRNADGTFW